MRVSFRTAQQRRNGVRWDSRGWIGRDLNRLWFRADGEADAGRPGDAEVHLFYGRAFARWWDVVVGLRQDLRPGPAQSWLAVGVKGLAPYWFDVEATAYLGAGGQTAARLKAEYELLFTNRLALQPLVEVHLYGQPNVERGIGAGVSSFDAGLRIRYELRREFAPYLGVTWHDRFGETAGFAEAAGGSSRQGCNPAGASPAVSIAQVGHVAMPHPGMGNHPGDAWCKRPGRPARRCCGGCNLGA